MKNIRKNYDMLKMKKKVRQYSSKNDTDHYKTLKDKQEHKIKLYNPIQLIIPKQNIKLTNNFHFKDQMKIKENKENIINKNDIYNHNININNNKNNNNNNKNNDNDNNINEINTTRKHTADPKKIRVGNIKNSNDILNRIFAANIYPIPNVKKDFLSHSLNKHNKILIINNNNKIDNNNNVNNVNHINHINNIDNNTEKLGNIIINQNFGNVSKSKGEHPKNIQINIINNIITNTNKDIQLPNLNNKMNIINVNNNKNVGKPNDKKKLNIFFRDKRLSPNGLFPNNKGLIKLNLGNAMGMKIRKKSNEQGKINNKFNVNNIIRRQSKKNEIISNEKEKINIEFACSLEQNKRFCENKMEDCVSCHRLKESLPHPIGLFCVFDGHNGKGVAKYLEDNFHKYFLKNCKKLIDNFDMEKILENTFSEVDKEILNINSLDNMGSTATVVAIIKDKAYCANIGDSSCFYVNEDNSYTFSYNHNCKDASEVERIKKNKGMVFHDRVYGTLSLTRAFGDKEYKEYGVTSKPSIFKVNLKESKVKYIVLASDGLWNVLDKDELYTIIKSKNYTPKELSDKLITLSLERVSKDNISCIVIKF